MLNLTDYIFTAEEVLSSDVCEAILDEYKDSTEWEPSYVGSPAGVVIDTDIRSASIISMSNSETLSRNSSVRKELDEEVFHAVGRCISAYHKQFPEFGVHQDSGYDMLRYRTGERYTQHVDSSSEVFRTVSCSISLNDGFSGGEFSFFNGAYNRIAPKGSAILFPSNFMYPHQILPVTSGERYSIVTWFI